MNASEFTMDVKINVVEIRFLHLMVLIIITIILLLCLVLNASKDINHVYKTVEGNQDVLNIVEKLKKVV